MGKQWMTLFFWAPKLLQMVISSHEIKRCLLLGRKVMTNLESIFKSRDITLLTKVHLVKAVVLPVAMYGCESWTIKKAERQRIDTFELWCWKRLLRVPCSARRSSQSILKEISPGCSLEGLMLKLKLQYFGHLMWRADTFEKTLMLEKIEGRRRRGRQRVRWLDGITDSMDMVLVDSVSWWWTGRPGMLWFMGLQRVKHDWATELKWTEKSTLLNIVYNHNWIRSIVVVVMMFLVYLRTMKGELYLINCYFIIHVMSFRKMSKKFYHPSFDSFN